MSPKPVWRHSKPLFKKTYSTEKAGIKDEVAQRVRALVVKPGDLSWDTHGGRREPTPVSCPLTSPCALLVRGGVACTVN